MIQIETRAPGECDAERLDAFESLVREGGEVMAVGLRSRIEAAHALVFAQDGGTLIGVGAVKHPSVAYRDAVFWKAGWDGTCVSYDYEIGWIMVDPERRGEGAGRKVTEACVTAVSGCAVFATSSVANVAMHSLLGRLGFTRVGRPYASELDDDSLVLFTRGGAADEAVRPGRLTHGNTEK